MNTVQFRTVWAEPSSDFGNHPGVFSWDQFVVPSTNQTFHGIWVTYEKMMEHVNIRSVHGWKEWI